jgi:hypothetical protein
MNPEYINTKHKVHLVLWDILIFMGDKGEGM